MRWLVLVLVAGNAIANPKCDRQKLSAIDLSAPRADRVKLLWDACPGTPPRVRELLEHPELAFRDARAAREKTRYRDAIELTKASPDFRLLGEWVYQTHVDLKLIFNILVGVLPLQNPINNPQWKFDDGIGVDPGLTLR